MSLQKWLRQFEVEKGSELTHTSIGKPACSYYIPTDKQEVFTALYIAAMEAEQPLHLTEKHRDISPILIDLDFRQDQDTHVYTTETIEEIIAALFKPIQEFLVVPQNPKAFVLEKPPRPQEKTQGTYKDGIHIVFPEIVTKPEFQQYLRERSLKDIAEILEPCRFLNTIDDIYDKSIIKGNWLMYGSNKPNEPNKWTVTHVYTYTDDQLIPNSLDFYDTETPSANMRDHAHCRKSYQKLVPLAPAHFIYIMMVLFERINDLRVI